MKSTPMMVRRLAVSVAAGAGLLALTAAPAAAQVCYPPGSAACQTGPTLALSVTVVRRGADIQVTVNGFGSATTVTITIQSVEQTIGSVVTDQQGRGTTSVTIPSDIELGAHTISAKGLGANGAQRVVTAGITVVGANGATGVVGSTGSTGSTSSGSTGRDSLARTGAVVVPTAAAGFALVAGGVVLRRSAKKRKAIPV